jgi:hypothetical protein
MALMVPSGMSVPSLKRACTRGLIAEIKMSAIDARAEVAPTRLKSIIAGVEASKKMRCGIGLLADHAV